ncbi:unnamed protein product [Sphagnum jensenii]|uniref:CHAT domain-containing protein n=1 Tax=Sphagnum jensenii TaxID=128206 RepID=A0ABP0WPQ0_9BRYO
MELSTGTESEGDTEETSLFTLMAGVPTLKQVIDSSDIDNYRETSDRILQWCHQVSQGRDCTEELVEMCKHIIEQVGDTEHLQYFAAQAWKMLGETYLRQRQIKQGQEAQEKFFKVMLSLPDDPSWQENVERCYLLSKAYLDNGKPDESRKFSAKGLQYLEGKEVPFAYRLMTQLHGRASEESGDLVGAVKYYQEALRIMKACGSDGMEQVTLYYQLGGVQKFLGRYIEAISTLEQGLIYAEQSANVNLQLNCRALLIDIYEELVYSHNFILSERQAKEALQRCLEACWNLIQSYPALRSPRWDHLSGKIWDLKHAEEELKSAEEKGDLALQIQASFFICAARLDPESPNRDDACAREAFEECQKCLKAWDSQNGNVLTPQSEVMRLKLAFYAFSLGELEEAEEILKVLLRSYERMLDNMFMAGDASEELVLKFRESTKVAVIAMMQVQLQLADRDRNLQAGTASSLMSTASNHSGTGILNTFKALMWSERARARTAMFHLAPGFCALSLQPGDKRESEGLQFPDAHNLPYDHNPEALIQSLGLTNDPLLDAPWRHAIKDHIRFNNDDSYALNFLVHAVRDSKMAFVEYFILNEEQLLIIVFNAIPDSTDPTLMDGSQNLAHEEEGVSHEVQLRASIVDIKAKLDDDDIAGALEETKGLAETATSGSSSDPISVMNANRFYTNEILTGLVAKSQRLVIEVQNKLKNNEYGTDIKAEEEELDRLYSILYNLLIEPVEKYLETIPSDYNLVIIPHEDMGLIPFATLTNGKQALIERFAITVAPSICTVRLCGKLYENKVFGDGGELLVGRETGYPEGWLSLDNAHAEVEAVQEFCVSPVSITESSHDGSNDNMKTIVKQYMQKASWLHFVAHGQVSKEFPRGSLLLGCDDSSRLTGDEIAQAGPLPARAAVLSACQTALGSVRGDGILGFARAFILAGVPITILSMWEVRGSFCIEFMKNLYSALRGGLDVPHAMQKVILDMKQEQVKFRSSRINITKRKWRSSDLAAFACYGYPGVKFTAEKGKDIAPPWLDLLQDHSRYKGGKGQSGGSSSTSSS